MEESLQEKTPGSVSDSIAKRKAFGIFEFVFWNPTKISGPDLGAIFVDL